jgi:hypothetical protein
MPNEPRQFIHSTQSTNLADLLERILDKGVVISGDIRIKLVDIELLTIQIRLVICSVDRAIELGMDWWRQVPQFQGDPARATTALPPAEELAQLRQRLAELEAQLAAAKAPTPASIEGPKP